MNKFLMPTSNFKTSHTSDIRQVKIINSNEASRLCQLIVDASYFHILNSPMNFFILLQPLKKKCIV